MKRFLISFIFIILTQTIYADNPHKLSVSGESTIYKPADKLSIMIGVETYDQDVKKAIQANARKMQDIHDALLKMGLSETELQTKAYTVVPRHTPTPENPPPKWEPTIIGYEVRNTLEIRTDKLELAGNMIDVASSAGANFIHSISFSLQNEQQAKAEAIAQAFHNAESYAQAAVKEAGLQLGQIIDLTVNQPVKRTELFKGSRNLGSQEIPTMISPRDVEVSATVSIVYEIESTKANNRILPKR